MVAYVLFDESSSFFFLNFFAMTDGFWFTLGSLPLIRLTSDFNTLNATLLENLIEFSVFFFSQNKLKVIRIAEFVQFHRKNARFHVLVGDLELNSH